MPQEQAIRDERADIDRETIRAVATGSEDALAALYDRHASVVYGLARRIVVQPDVAEEVVQDVFTQIWRDAPRYAAERGTVAGWIVMLTRARAIDRLRSRRARPDLAGGADPAAIVSVASSGNPESAATSAEEVRVVRAALAGVPASQREVLDLAYYEGLTHTEIAARTGLPIGTVKTRLRAAIATLRAALGRRA